MITKSSRANLYFAAFAANVGAFSLGSLYSWTSPALPKLTAKDSWLPLDVTEASWIGSLIGIGSIFGPCVGGVLVDRIGRKASMIVSVFVGLAAWAILYFSQKAWHIYISRLVGGLGGGIMFCCVPLYIAEVAENDVRSAVGASVNFFFSSGYLIEYIFGPQISYWNLILVSCIAPFIFFILFPFIPESPYFYILKNDSESAYKSLRTLRTGWSDLEIKKEFELVKESVEQGMNEKGTLIELVNTKANRRGLILACGSMFFQQFSGINVVLFYSETIFNHAGKMSLSASNATIIVAVILIAFAGIAMPLTKIFGMRTMFIVSASGMFFFQTITGLYFYLLHTGTDVSAFNWLPITNLVGYVVAYSLGFGPLPNAVKGEVFSPNVKGISSAVTVSTSWGLSFVTTKLFPYIKEVGGMYTVFWIFSVSCFFAIPFCVFVMIDTRNMSLQDIQDLLNSGKRTLKREEKQESSTQKSTGPYSYGIV